MTFDNPDKAAVWQTILDLNDCWTGGRPEDLANFLVIVGAHLRQGVGELIPGHQHLVQLRGVVLHQGQLEGGLAGGDVPGPDVPAGLDLRRGQKFRELPRRLLFLPGRLLEDEEAGPADRDRLLLVLREERRSPLELGRVPDEAQVARGVDQHRGLARGEVLH